MLEYDNLQGTCGCLAGCAAGFGWFAFGLGFVQDTDLGGGDFDPLGIQVAR